LVTTASRRPEDLDSASSPPAHNSHAVTTASRRPEDLDPTVERAVTTASRRPEDLDVGECCDVDLTTRTSQRHRGALKIST